MNCGDLTVKVRISLLFIIRDVKLENDFVKLRC